MPCSQPVPSLCSQSPFYTARSEHLKYHITIVYSYVCLPEKVWAPPSKDKVVPICMGPALGTAAGIQMFANSSASSQEHTLSPCHSGLPGFSRGLHQAASQLLPDAQRGSGPSLLTKGPLTQSHRLFLEKPPSLPQHCHQGQCPYSSEVTVPQCSPRSKSKDTKLVEPAGESRGLTCSWEQPVEGSGK
jgi:hypothetical protein